MTQPQTAHPLEGAKLRNAAIAAMAMAGLIHLGIAPASYGFALAHGLFFVVIGGAQLAWSVAFWRKPSPLLCQLGIVMAGGAVVLWGLTRLLPAPFAGTPGVVSALGVTAALSESIAVVALIETIVARRSPGSRKSNPLLILAEILALVLVALAAYAFGVAMETLLPAWGLGARHR